MSDAVNKYLQLKKELNEDRTSYNYIKKKLAKKRGIDFTQANFVEEKKVIQEEVVPVIEETPIEIVTQASQLISKQEEIKEETSPDVKSLKAELEFLRKELESLRRVKPTFNAPLVGSSGGGELNLLKPVHTVVDYDILGSGGKDLILCDTRENDIVITLPKASKNNGFIAHVKKMHRNNQLYIRGFSETELIDEQVQIVINTIYVTLQLACDGYNWYIV